MKEKLINRVGRIISGSVHLLIDTIENAAPETVLSEAIREIGKFGGHDTKILTVQV